jgi:hypothetical protein
VVLAARKEAIVGFNPAALKVVEGPARVVEGLTNVAAPVETLTLMRLDTVPALFCA